MKILVWFSFSSIALLLSSCTDNPNTDVAASDAFIDELPGGVLAIAAPYQDLNTVRIDPLDGCYVYQHAGQVETTFIPLRTRNGSPICTGLAGAARAG